MAGGNKGVTRGSVTCWACPVMIIDELCELPQ